MESSLKKFSKKTQIAEKDLLIKNMQLAQGQHEDKDKLFSKITPEVLKKKARKMKIKTE